MYEKTPLINGERKPLLALLRIDLGSHLFICFVGAGMILFTKLFFIHFYKIKITVPASIKDALEL